MQKWEEYMTQKGILLIGLDPTLVDFSHSSERNAEQVRAAGVRLMSG